MTPSELFNLVERLQEQSNKHQFAAQEKHNQKYELQRQIRALEEQVRLLDHDIQALQNKKKSVYDEEQDALRDFLDEHAPEQDAIVIRVLDSMLYRVSETWDEDYGVYTYAFEELYVLE